MSGGVGQLTGAPVHVPTFEEEAMTTTVTETLTTARRRGRRAARPSGAASLHRAEARGAWVLMAPYVLLFLVAAAIPIGYAFYISLQKPATLVNPQRASAVWTPSSPSSPTTASSTRS